MAQPHGYPQKWNPQQLKGSSAEAIKLQAENEELEQRLAILEVRLRESEERFEQLAEGYREQLQAAKSRFNERIRQANQALGEAARQNETLEAALARKAPLEDSNSQAELQDLARKHRLAQAQIDELRALPDLKPTVDALTAQLAQADREAEEAKLHLASELKRFEEKESEFRKSEAVQRSLSRCIEELNLGDAADRAFAEQCGKEVEEVAAWLSKLDPNPSEIASWAPLLVDPNRALQADFYPDRPLWQEAAMLLNRERSSALDEVTKQVGLSLIRPMPKVDKFDARLHEEMPVHRRPAPKDRPDLAGCVFALVHPGIALGDQVVTKAFVKIYAQNIS